MSREAADQPAGLCASCRHARIVRSAKDALFVRCGLSDTDPRFPRYPYQPVLRCAGHEAKDAD